MGMFALTTKGTKGKLRKTRMMASKSQNGYERKSYPQITRIARMDNDSMNCGGVVVIAAVDEQPRRSDNSWSTVDLLLTESAMMMSMKLCIVIITM